MVDTFYQLLESSAKIHKLLLKACVPAFVFHI